MAKKDKQIQKITHVPDRLDTLLAEIRGLILSARQVVARSVDTLQVLTNFQIGRRIVEYEQDGAQRAVYGKEVLKELSKKLTDEFGKGFSLTNLKLMRQFYFIKQAEIGQTPSDQLPIIPKSQTLSDLFPKSVTVSRKSVSSQNTQTVKSKFTLPLWKLPCPKTPTSMPGSINCICPAKTN